MIKYQDIENKMKDLRELVNNYQTVSNLLLIY